MRIIFAFVSIFLFYQLLSGQNSQKYTGTLYDISTNAPVSHAAITLKSDPNKHAISDSSGKFTLTIDAYPDTLCISHISYETFDFPIDRNVKNPFSCGLVSKTESIEAVDIVFQQTPETEKTLEKIEWKKSDISSLSGQFGDVDIIKSLQTKSGIQKSNEINASLNVRGEGHGNNHISYDGITVYNSYHLLGLTPMFNGDVLNNIALLKSGFPADNGGYLSSYLNLETLDPLEENKKFRAELGNVSGGLLYQGPIMKDKASLIVSGRYGSYQLIKNLYDNLHSDNKDYVPLPEYSLYDINLVAGFKIFKNQRVHLSFFHNTDDFRYSPISFRLSSKWSNNLLSVSTSRTINNRLYIKITSGISNYKLQGTYNPSTDISRTNKILGFENKLLFSYRPANLFRINFGSFLINTHYKIINKEKILDYTLREAEIDKSTLLWGAFIDNRWQVIDKLSLQAGIRMNIYPSAEDPIYYSPRLLATYSGDFLGINLSYDQTWQFNHMITPLGFNMPADLWLPADNKVKPQFAEQIASNIMVKFKSFDYKLGIYTKNLLNQTELLNGAELLDINPYEEITSGKGSAYGFETSASYTADLFKIELYYTYSHTERTFDSINNGKTFLPSYDMPHKFDVVTSFNITKNISVDLSWFWSSGSVTTMPTGYSFLTHAANTEPYPIYTERNNFRMPPSHRLDISVGLKKEYRWGNTNLSLGVYNAYNQTNPYFLYFKIVENDEEMSVIPQQLGVFPCVPFFRFSLTMK